MAIKTKGWNANRNDWVRIRQLVQRLASSAIPQLVPYTGATANVDLGTFTIKAANLTTETTPLNIVYLGIGAGSGNTGINFTAIGNNAGNGNTGPRAVAVGFEAGMNNTSNDSVMVGYRCGKGNTGSYPTLYGNTAGGNASGAYLTAIGVLTALTNTGNYTTIIGGLAGTSNSGDHTLMIGHKTGISNTYDECVLIGNGAAASANRQIIFGGGLIAPGSGPTPIHFYYTDLYMGDGVQTPSGETAQGFTIHASGGNGTDQAGSNLTIAGGRGTGSGAGGTIKLQVAAAGSSGSSLNALATIGEATATGFDVTGALTVSTTAVITGALTVGGGATITGDVTMTSNASDTILHIDDYSDGAITDSPEIQARKGKGTLASPVIVEDNHNLLNINARGHDGADFDNVTAQILMRVDGDVSGNVVPTEIVFKTSATDTAGLADNMVIAPNGDIKISDYAIWNNTSNTLQFVGGTTSLGSTFLTTTAMQTASIALVGVSLITGQVNITPANETGDGLTFNGSVGLTGGGPDSGGVGSAFIVTLGDGGPQVGFSGNGGNAGDFTLTGGDGGNSSAGNGGTGTSLHFKPGLKGTGGTSTDGVITFGDGGSTNYIEINLTGDIKPKGSAFLIFEKASGNGIKVDQTTPTFGWGDLLGEVRIRTTGANRPTRATYNGQIGGVRFSNGDKEEFEYHIPHDYVIGTDIHLHVHWSQISATNTGGTIDFTYHAIYAKGHNQATGSQYTSTPITALFSSTDAGTKQYQHHLTEVVISAATATAALFDRDDIEPDGVIKLTLVMTTNSLTDSVAVTDPFIDYADIHYQTTGLIGTKSRTPNFYA